MQVSNRAGSDPIAHQDSFYLEPPLEVNDARTAMHQMFGRYRGTVKTDDGEIITTIDGLIGFAEEHRARW